jgi:hypothetical protein
MFTRNASEAVEIMPPALAAGASLASFSGEGQSDQGE